MIEKIYLIVGWAVLADMVAIRFEPLQPVKNKLLRYFEVFHFISSSLNKLLTCSRCLAFWVVTSVYLDIVMGALAGLVGFLINHLHDRINAWYE